MGNLWSLKYNNVILVLVACVPNERVWIPYSKMYDIDIPYLKTVYGIWISIFSFENAFDNKKQETFYTNFKEYEVQLSLVLENQS
jgi:hypothetical protein